MTPTLFPPVLKQAVRDRRLSVTERAALLLLWQSLSAAEYRPLKAESLAADLGVKRQSAARALSHLVAYGYLLMHVTGPRDPRQYLLVNHNPLPPAPPARRFCSTAG